jgi:predicted dehydrogenase
MKTRIAVTGAGYIGRDHIASIATNPKLELASIVDPSPAARAVADEHHVTLYPDLSTMIAADRPDGVVVATPNPLHKDHAETCIAAGLPLLLEKPVTDRLDTSEKLYRFAQEHDATVLIGHHRVHSPIMRLAREVVDSGQLGDLVCVSGSALFYKPDEYYEQAPWRKEKGAGPILLNMTHEIQNLRLLCGEITNVEARTSNATRGFDIEDTAALVLTFASGVLGTFLVSDTVASPRSWEQTSHENPQYTTYETEDCYHLAGTMGSLSVPTMKIHSYARPEDRSWWKPFEESTAELHRQDPVALEDDHFGAVVRGEATPACTIRDGLMNMRVVEAIHESAATGRSVDVPLS